VHSPPHTLRVQSVCSWWTLFANLVFSTLLLMLLLLRRCCRKGTCFINTWSTTWLTVKSSNSV
jgi:hypothetical protein